MGRVKLRPQNQACGRSERLAPVILRELSAVISKSHNFEGTSITRIDLNHDCSSARIYVQAGFTKRNLESVEDKQGFADSLAKNAGYYQGHLSKVLKIKRSPQLLFEYDLALEAGEELNFMLDQLKKNSQEFS